MSTKDQAPQYAVINVKTTTAPEGIDGNNWCEYVIGCGNSMIKGKKRGTLKEVRAHAETVADELNSRTGVNGRSAWAPRQTKK